MTINDKLDKLLENLINKEPIVINKSSTTGSTLSLQAIVPSGYKYAVIITNFCNSYNSNVSITSSTNEPCHTIGNTSAVVTNTWASVLISYLIIFDSIDTKHIINCSMNPSVGVTSYGSHFMVLAM